MKIKTELFCSLASHPKWQDWLKNTTDEIYQIFIDRFSKSTGCSNNARIMMEILPLLKAAGLEAILFSFLGDYFPNILINDDEEESILPVEKYFYVKSITYPRRTVIEADTSSLNDELMKFLNGKIQYEFLIIRNRAFVEYLCIEDIEIKDSIPESKWLIKMIKAKKTKLAMSR
jgi:hypothetical protein